MESPSTEALKNAIKITQTPFHYRTLDETNTLMAYLSRFDFFRNKVGDKGLEDVLQLASKYVRYTKIPAGEFLYHVSKSFIPLIPLLKLHLENILLIISLRSTIKSPFFYPTR